MQVLSETGNAKSIAFEEIDKAPEEKARGITISTVCSLSFFCHTVQCSFPFVDQVVII
jgi:translation elongation factor EF-Tu-like GTPase